MNSFQYVGAHRSRAKALEARLLLETLVIDIVERRGQGLPCVKLLTTMLAAIFPFLSTDLQCMPAAKLVSRAFRDRLRRPRGCTHGRLEERNQKTKERPLHLCTGSASL